MLKIPFKPIYASPFKSCISPIKNVHLHQSPPIVHKSLCLLQQFSKNLMWVKSIHAQVLANCIDGPVLAAKLVRAYSDLGHLWYARQVFGRILQPKTILCNAIVGRYLRNEHYKEALELFKLMGWRHVI